MEVWKDIKGFEGRYQISDLGRVKSLARFRKGKSGSLVPIPERIMKLKRNRGGYLVAHLRGDSEKHWTVHQIVALHFIDNPEFKPTVNHKDGDKTNNCVTNLEWSTASEQMVHAIETGLYTPPDLSKIERVSKFDEVTRALVRDLRNQGNTLTSISKQVGMSVSEVHRTVKGLK